MKYTFNFSGRRVLLPTGVLFVIAVVLYAGRFLLINLALQWYIIPFVEEAVPGLELTVGRVHSDLFSTIDCNNIVIRYRLDDGGIIHAELPKLRVDFSLFDLRENQTALIRNATVLAEIKAAEVTLARSDSDAPLITNIKFPEISFPLPGVTLRYKTLIIARPDSRNVLRSGEITTLRLPVDRQTPSLPIGLTAAHVDLSYGNYNETAHDVRAECFYRPGSFGITRLMAAGEELARNVIVTGEDGKLSIEATLALWSGTVDFQAEIADEARGRFTASNIDFEKLSPLVSGDSVPMPETGILEGRGYCSFPVGEPQRLTGDITLVLGRTTFLSLPVDTFRLQASAADGRLHISEITLEAERDHAQLKSIDLPLAPLFTKNWPELAAQTSGHFRLAIKSFQKYAAQLPKSVITVIEPYAINEFGVQGEYANGSFEAPLFTINSEKYFIRAQNIRGELSPWMAGKDWQTIPVKAQLEIGSTDADFLARIFSKPLPLEGRLRAIVQLDGQIGSPALAFTVVGEKILFRDVPLDSITTTGRYRNQQLSLDRITVANRQDTLEGVFNYQAGLPGTYRGAFNLLVADIQDYLPEDIRERYQLRGDVAGKGGLSSEGDKLTGDILLQSDTLWYGDKKAEQVTIDAHLSGKDLSIRSLQGRYPEQGLVLSSAAADLSFNPQWDQFLVLLNDLSVTHKGRKINLLHPAKLRYGAGQTSMETPLEFQYATGIFSLTGSVLSDSVNLDLSGEIADGANFLEAMGGQAFSFDNALFTAGIEGNLKTPHVDLSGSIKQLRSSDTPALDGKFSFSFAHDKLKVKQFILRDAQSPRLYLQGELPLKIKDRRLELPDGPLHLAGEINLESSPFIPWLFQNEINGIGAVKGKLDIHGTRHKPIGFLRLQAEDLLLKNGSRWLPPEALTLDLSVTVAKNKVTFEKATIVSESASLQLQGYAVNQDFWDKAVLTAGKDAFATTGIDLHGSIACRSIDWLASRHEMLRRISGQVNADFTVSGTLAKPHVNGSISLQEGQMRLSGNMPALQDASLQAQLTDSALEIRQFSGTFGGAPVTSFGTITLPDTGGVAAIELRVSGKDLLFYRAEGISFRGDAALFVHGRTDLPQVDGDIVLTDARVTRNIDFVSSLFSGFLGRESPPPHFPAFTDPPLRDARFNLKITAKEPVLVANNMLRGKVMPHLELHGTGEVPYLSGKLYVNETTVALPAGKVKMDAGLVQFLENDPDRPVLELNGTAKMLGYDIVIGISGPYDAPVIMLSSTPSVSNEELLMLLLAGQRPMGDRNQQNQLKNYSSVAVYVGEKLIKSLFPNANNGSDSTILDRLQLEIGKNITQQGEETIEAQFIMAENIKNGQNAVLLTGEKDVWDKYNGGLRLVFKFK